MVALGQRDLIQTTRASAIVLRVLKRTFPEDYDRRCIYAAAGIRHLLIASGIDAWLNAGDFLALVVSPDGQQARMQGFGGASGVEAFSHYWVETPRLLIDLGPHLLPKGSSFPAAPLPLLCWKKAEALPAALRYRTRQQYASDAQMLFPPDIAGRMTAFLDDVTERGQRGAGAFAWKGWILADGASLFRAARNDVWAKSVLRFEQEANRLALPF